MEINPESSIGIFDSGVGGLTVCKAVHDLLPSENIIYFGDTARFPYGTRSSETIIKYSTEIAEYLISRGVKMIVIACNTSSAAALEHLRNSYDIPIIGVIDAGAKAAVQKLKGDIIGVIGTRATVQSGSYVRAIKKIMPDIKILQQQATLFVSITEEGLTDTEIAKLTAREYIQDMYNSGVRTLILGCTHFPLLKKSICEVFPDIELVDTGIEIAYEVQTILKEKNLENTKGIGHKGNIELFASDLTETLQRLKEVFFGNHGFGFNKFIING